MVQLIRRTPLPAPLESRDAAIVQLLEEGKSLARAGRISSAVGIFERALLGAHRTGNQLLCADALDWLSWLAWIDLDGARSAAYANRMLALELPTTSLEAFRLSIRQATQMLQQGDARRALLFLDTAERAGRDADIDSFMAYLSVKADICAALGETPLALGHAGLAVNMAEKRGDRYQEWRRLEYLGYIKYASGRLKDSMATYLRAEAVATSAALTWEVPFSRARAAWIAFMLGDLGRARSLIAASFESDETVRWMVVTRAWVGLTIGIAAGDDRLVERCNDVSHLTIALESGDAYTRARTVAAFVAYYIMQDDVDSATALLDRAVPSLTSPDCAWPLFEAIARYGDDELRECVARLLSAFESGHVMARAHRLFFAALRAGRDGDVAACERLALQAQRAFEENEHHYHAIRCIELAGRRSEAHRRFASIGAVRDARRTASAPARRGRPRGGGHAVGSQRREVLALLLTGATTSAIAERLGVSSRTIKNRVAEIFAVEDVSSRAELRALGSARRRSDDER